MASNSGGGFQRGGRPAPGPADGDFFGLAALVFGAGATLMLVAAIAAMYISSKSEDAVVAPPAPAPAPVEAAAAAPAIPEGAGVIFELVEGKPKESVYFDVGQSALAPDFAAVSAPFKAWIDGNPNDRIAVSGFSDPSGDAAANAALSKARAEAVAEGLVSLGVPADRIDLVKPAETSDATVTPAEARRVEITVTAG
jgi:outer membrane protein OmpA-like peptidoglycan-associated protein